MKRVAVVLSLMMWLAGVTWYWWESVPLAPTRRGYVPLDSRIQGITPSGQLRLCHARYLDGPGTRVVQCGPLEFWAFPECRKVRELFNRDDEIIDGPNRRSGEVLIRRSGRLLVVNSESGETIGELPDVPGARRFAMVPGKRQVLIDDMHDVHLYELGEENPIWTAPMVWLRPGEEDIVTANLVAVSKRSQRSPNSSLGSGVLRLETGELDSRFDHLGRLGPLRLAPNGRFVVATIMAPSRRGRPGELSFVMPRAVRSSGSFPSPPVGTR